MKKLLSAALLLCFGACCSLPAVVHADTQTKSHVLWKNPNGSISLWNVAADGSWLSQKDYGPFPGWTATSLSESADGLAHLIWTHTTDGAIALWNLNSDGSFLSQSNYGPFGGGWNAAAISGLIPPASGPAGGDLTGSYPNPLIKLNAIDHTKLASDSASLSQVSGGLITANTDINIARNTTVHGILGVTSDVSSAGVNFFLHGRGGGVGNNNGAARALVDGGPTDGLILNYANDFGQVNIESNTTVLGTLGVTGNVSCVGTVSANTIQITGGSDLAEPYKIAAVGQVQPLPGMVVAIDPNQTGQMIVCAHAYDNTVGGIISGANGIQPGVVLRQAGTVADGTLPIASIGRVWCWCDADAGGAITPGDLLTTSDTPGHAMRVGDYDKARGAILGKAMSSLKSGKGLVLVLVSLQ